MPRPHPKEFRDDVVAVARQGEVLVKQVGKDFGISRSRACATGCTPLTSRTVPSPA